MFFISPATLSTLTTLVISNIQAYRAGVTENLTLHLLLLQNSLWLLRGIDAIPNSNSSAISPTACCHENRFRFFRESFHRLLNKPE